MEEISVVECHSLAINEIELVRFMRGGDPLAVHKKGAMIRPVDSRGSR
jgi:hypothetical protein